MTVFAATHDCTRLPACSHRGSRRVRRVWPNYQYCVDRAPLAHDGERPDISRADFEWCMTAIDWGLVGSRYDDLKRGRVKPIYGEASFEHLRLRKERGETAAMSERR